MLVRRLADEAETRALGAHLAARCPAGCVVLLRGELGAGKTTFADGFVAALGGGRATSPTFVLAHRCDGARVPLWHLDLYRLDDPAEVEALDLSQYLPPDGITLVEWPDRAGDAWPPDRIEVLLEHDGGGRRATVSGCGRGAKALS